MNIPAEGYVGVGRVTGAAVPAARFRVPGPDGAALPILDLPDRPDEPFRTAEGEEDYLARVEWIETVPRAHPIKERGFFGNQHTVCRPTTEAWDHTVARLTLGFGLTDDGT